MGEEKNLAASAVDHLLDTLSRCQPYEELTNIDTKTKKPARRALLIPFTVQPVLFVTTPKGFHFSDDIKADLPKV